MASIPVCNGLFGWNASQDLRLNGHLSQMSRDKSQQNNADKGVKGSSNAVGVGTLLRNAREKKALNYAQITELTRIRPHILEALENEQWEKMPSRVFALGFIRSYARVLGLIEADIVALYQKAEPIQSTPLKPLQRPVRRMNVLPVVIGALLFAMAASVYYLWKEDVLQKRTSITDENPDNPLDIRPESMGMQIAIENNEPLSPQQNKTISQPEIDINHIGIVSPGVSSKVEEKMESHFEQTLTAYVKETTWIRIFVDDDDPKEYIFREGSQPQWDAEEGFELLIGNAGGIEFVFNGKEIKNLGKPGQVIRLTLPENYKKRSSLE